MCIYMCAGVFGRPTLLPVSLYVCPNETLTKTLICHDSHVHCLLWEVIPYTNEGQELYYIPSLISEGDIVDTKRNRSGILFSELVNLNRIDELYTGNITISLRIAASEVQEMLNVTCTTLLRNDQFHSFAKVYPAG